MLSLKSLFIFFVLFIKTLCLFANGTTGSQYPNLIVTEHGEKPCCIIEGISYSLDKGISFYHQKYKHVSDISVTKDTSVKTILYVVDLLNSMKIKSRWMLIDENAGSQKEFTVELFKSDVKKSKTLVKEIDVGEVIDIPRMKRVSEQDRLNDSERIKHTKLAIESCMDQIMPNDFDYSDVKFFKADASKKGSFWENYGVYAISIIDKKKIPDNEIPIVYAHIDKPFIFIMNSLYKKTRETSKGLPDGEFLLETENYKVYFFGVVPDGWKQIKNDIRKAFSADIEILWK